MHSESNIQHLMSYVDVNMNANRDTMAMGIDELYYRLPPSVQTTLHKPKEEFGTMMELLQEVKKFPGIPTDVTTTAQSSSLGMYLSQFNKTK
jgi:hypothetical protein